MTPIVLCLVVLSAVIVGIDAHGNRVRRGSTGSLLFDGRPFGWFCAVLLFWIIALPIYVFSVRPKHVELTRRYPRGTIPTLKERQAMGGWHATPLNVSLLPPGTQAPGAAFCQPAYNGFVQPTTPRPGAFCSNCGTPTAGAFCSGCGAPLRTAV